MVCNELSGCNRYVKSSSATSCQLPVHFLVKFSFVGALKHGSSVRFNLSEAINFEVVITWTREKVKFIKHINRVSNAIGRATFKHILDHLVWNTLTQYHHRTEWMLAALT